MGVKSQLNQAVDRTPYSDSGKGAGKK